jgi:hypothetical protein
MSTFSVYEGEGSVYDELENNPNIKVGDLIYYLTNNQEGIRKYKVVKVINNNFTERLDLNEIYECDNIEP